MSTENASGPHFGSGLNELKLIGDAGFCEHGKPGSSYASC
jgi:hypothetical protein